MSVERARRWPPRQRIHLSREGDAARAAYQILVREAREQNAATGALESQLAQWSGQLGVRPSDGVLLEELAAKPLTLSELSRAVEACGERPSDVKAGVDRLYGAELIEPPAQKPEAPASDPRRFY